MNDASNKSNSGDRSYQQDEGDEDDGVVQRDDEERFIRYNERIGAGRFKVVYKGFDERNGLDVAWVIISGDQLGLELSTLLQLLTETQRNTKLKHKHIIRCFKCWKSDNQINLVTELFTSGNLREFIQEHNQLGPDALRKFSKQILEGIDYLHSQDPPVVHGDLRCDKIYVNGNEGTVKIGDLGLVTLLTRYKNFPAGSHDAELANHPDGMRLSPEYDILSFGMCMLEMYTQVVVDPHSPPQLTAELIASVRDEWARSVLSRCFNERPAASELLQQFAHHPRAKPSPARIHTPPPLDGPVPHADQHAAKHLHELHQSMMSQNGAAGTRTMSHRTTSDAHEVADGGEAGGDEELPRLKSCELKGEDFMFSVRQSGSSQPQTARSVFIQLSMTTLEESSVDSTISRTIEFEHNLDKDTPGSVGQELQDEYHLSDTDRTIVTAIITECLSTLTPCVPTVSFALQAVHVMPNIAEQYLLCRHNSDVS